MKQDFILLYQKIGMVPFISFSVLVLSGCNEKTNIKEFYGSNQFQLSQGGSCGFVTLDLDYLIDDLKEKISDEKYKLFKNDLRELTKKNVFLRDKGFTDYEHRKLLKFSSLLDLILEKDNININNFNQLKNLVSAKIQLIEHGNQNNYDYIFYEKELEKLSNGQKEYFEELEADNWEREYAINKIKKFEELYKNLKLIDGTIPILIHSKDNKINTVDVKDNKVNEIHLTDEQLSEFNNFVDYFNNITLKSNLEKNSLGEYSGLSKAFAIQAIFNYFSKFNGQMEQGNTSLGKILKAHSYVNLTQIGIGTIEEAKYVVDVVKAINSSELKSFNPVLEVGAGTFGRVTAGASALLGLVSMGFDIAELSKAKTYAQKVTFGTQLTFDGIGVGLGAAAIGGSSIAGILATPLAGIGFGFTAVASRFAELTQSAIENAKYFNQYEDSHSLDNFDHLYSFISSNNKPILSFAYKKINSNDNLEFNKSVIKEVNLTDKNSIKIKYGSNYILKTKHADRASGKNYYWYNLWGPNPYAIEGIGEFQGEGLHPENYVNIRESLDIPEDKVLAPNSVNYKLFFDDNKTIMLPVTPEAYIWYDYHLAVGFVNFHYDTEETRAITKIQSKGKFLFAYEGYSIFPEEHAITKLKFHYRKTDIKIKLGQDNTNIITPEIPKEWEHKINYLIEGSDGGNYQILVRNGASYHISGTGKEVIILDISELDDRSFYNIETSELLTNKIQFAETSITIDKLRKPKYILLKDKDNNTIIYNLEKNLFSSNNFVFDNNKHSFNLQQIKDYIKRKISKISIEGIIRINYFPLKEVIQDSIKEEEGRLINHLADNKNYQAWYDINSDSFIYTNYLVQSSRVELDKSSLYSLRDPKNINFIGVSGENIYFSEIHKDDHGFEKNSIYVSKFPGDILNEVSPSGFNPNNKSIVISRDRLIYESNFSNFINFVVTIDTETSKINSISIKNNTEIDKNYLVLQLENKFQNMSKIDREKFERYVNITSKNNNNLNLNIWYDFKNRKIIGMNEEDNNTQIIGTLDEKYYYFFNHDKKTLFIIDNEQVKIIATNINSAALIENNIIVENEKGYILSFDVNNEKLIIGFKQKSSDIDIKSVIGVAKNIFQKAKFSSVFSIQYEDNNEFYSIINNIEYHKIDMN